LRYEAGKGVMMKVKLKREKSISKVSLEFLSNSFNCVLEGIFIPFPSRTIFCAERIQTNFKHGCTTACVWNIQTKHGANAGVSAACQSLGNPLELETQTAQASLGEKKDRPKYDAL
jgi:hypothetical protein